jgi:hypothetical protein
MDVVAVSKMSKAELIRIIRRDAHKQGRTWVLGGPERWSKDELVSYVMHEVQDD